MPDDEVKAVIGVLDIYGFEIFSVRRDVVPPVEKTVSLFR